MAFEIGWRPFAGLPFQELLTQQNVADAGLSQNSQLMSPQGPLGEIQEFLVRGPVVSISSEIEADHFLNMPSRAATQFEIDSRPFFDRDAMISAVGVVHPKPKQLGFFQGLRNYFFPKKYETISHSERQRLLQSGNPYGIWEDAVGNFVYPSDSEQAIVRDFGEKRIHKLDFGILQADVVGVPDPILLFPEDSAISRSGDAAFDYRDLIASGHVRAQGPIIFYQECVDPSVIARTRGTKPGVAAWFVTLRRLGYPIHFVNDITQLRDTLTRLKPSSVLVSASQDLLSFAFDALKIVKGSDPEIIVGLGGAGASPEAAGAFDFAMIGESYFTLPVFLNAVTEQRRRGHLHHVDRIKLNVDINKKK